MRINLEASFTEDTFMTSNPGPLLVSSQVQNNSGSDAVCHASVQSTTRLGDLRSAPCKCMMASDNNFAAWSVFKPTQSKLLMNFKSENLS
jgi:hypothetical protein